MAKTSEKIKQKLKLLPNKPGVYLMKDKDQNIIYVGKASRLTNRVRSYFLFKHNDSKTTKLVEMIDDFDYIVTNSESEALLLEANLIKQYKPKYNILLKDDKKFPFIKITMNEPFPRLEVTRDLKQDGNKYFGPYTDTHFLRSTLRSLEWIFTFRTCTREIPEGPPIYTKACINLQLKKCSAPCIGLCSTEQYRKSILQIIQFLLGKSKDLIDSFQKEMMQYSDEMKFEEAAKVRDRLQQLQAIQRHQTMFFTDELNRDIIGYYREERWFAVALLRVINGKLLYKEIYTFENAENEETKSVLKEFLQQYYSNRMDKLPDFILLQEEPEDYDVLNQWLGRKMSMPTRGDYGRLISIAKKNAFHYVEEQKLNYLRKSTRTVFPIQELKEKLGLSTLPRKIICIDISTLLGVDTVSSLVFFENGKPKKKQYRHFIMEEVVGQDDFASVAETLKRYFSHLEEETWEKPDLIMIDGGKGQLSSAYAILKESQYKDINMISIAKRIEELFLPNQSESIILPKTSTALRLLTQIRDEAHRFAITFHRKKRASRLIASELDNIMGLGEDLKFLLLKTYGSVEKIKMQSIEELTEVKGVGPILAERIFVKLHQE